MDRREEAKRGEKLQRQAFLWNADYVPAEQNLEALGYFSARYSRPRIEESQLSKVITLSDNRRVEIVPSAKYGLPNAEDLDFYRAFLKICDERVEWVKVGEGDEETYHPRLPSPIGFSSRELIAKAGRHKNDRNIVAVRNWMKRLNATVIHGELYNAKIRALDVHIGLEPLFKKFVSVGERMPDGQLAAQNYVWLADWFIDNYFFFYTRRIDLNFHQRLRHAISKTLYPLLDNAWFASNGAPYTKSYKDLCAVLDIKMHSQLSRVRHQLDASNEELVREQFVAKYDYPLTETGEWSGNIRWWPGPKWLHDQEQKGRKHGLPCEIDDRRVLLAPNGDTPSCPPQEPQLALPLTRAARPVESDDRLGGYVRRFYRRLGQSRVTQQQVRAGAEILRDLVHGQGYSWEEVEFALEWMIDNKEERFGGKIQSLGLLPHVIGDALKEKASRERKREKQRAHAEAVRQEERRAAQRQRVEGHLAALLPAQRARLRREAIKNLTEQGVKREFMLESVIKAEMLRVLTEDAAWATVRAREAL
ncbi:MAG: hypothetical protein NZ578_09600 [Candidatus Binatia bacterium]|nr:hypothetical protein [Candidatus Binatia bacterium]